MKDKKTLDINLQNDNSEWISSPDGKYKFPKPKSIDHNDLLDGGKRSLPDIIIQGYKTVWVHDSDANTIFNMIQRGYDFVPQDQLDKIGIGKREIFAGIPKTDGNAAKYYAMMISDSKWKEIEDARRKDNKKLNEDLLKPEGFGGALKAEIELGNPDGSVIRN